MNVRRSITAPERLEHTLQNLGVQSYWDRVSPLVTEYGFRVAGALVFLVIALYLSGMASRGVRAWLERAHIERTLARFSSSVVRVLILALAVITCMAIVGIPVTSFAAMLGAAGLAVGLALQGSLSNIAAGAALSITRPFKVGDLVAVAGQRGIVDAIDLFTTTLNTLDNRRIIIPNNQIFGTIIENDTYHEFRRVDFTVTVYAEHDLDKTCAALRAAVRSVHDQPESHPPEIVLDAVGDPGVVWIVRIWADRERVLTIKDDTLRAVKSGLDKAGIAVVSRVPGVPVAPAPAPAAP